MTDTTSGNDLAAALDAVYAYATVPDNWEDMMRLLAHLDAGVDFSEGPGESEPTQTFMAHLARAQDLASRLYRPEKESWPERFAYLLIDTRQKIVAANDSGKALFNEFCVSVEPGQRLSFHSGLEAGVPGEMLGKVKAGEAGPHVLRLLSEAGELRLFCNMVGAAHIPPALLKAAGMDGADLLCALIAPQREDSASSGLIRLAFGLTPAEARLAAQLKRGFALKEAAQALEISVNTARNQLKSIFDKLGVNRQSDLIRHLADLNMLAAYIEADSEEEGAASGPVTSAERKMFRLTDGRLLAYRDLGAPDGFPVFVFQSLIVSSLMRPREAEVAGRLGIRLISLERPGTGLSTPDPQLSYARFAQDVKALADGLGFEKLAIFAWASGAPFALAAASALGARATRVALVAPRLAFRPDIERGHAAAAFFGGLRRHPWVIDAVFSIMRSKRSRRFIGPMVRRFFDNSPADHAAMAGDPSLIDFFADGMIEGLAESKEGPVAESQLFVGKQVLDLGGLARGVFVWQGDLDRMNRPEDVDRMLQGIPVARMERVVDGGHLIAVSRFGEIIAALKRDAGWNGPE